MKNQDAIRPKGDEPRGNYQEGGASGSCDRKVDGAEEGMECQPCGEGMKAAGVKTGERPSKEEVD